MQLSLVMSAGCANKLQRRSHKSMVVLPSLVIKDSGPQTRDGADVPILLLAVRTDDDESLTNKKQEVTTAPT